MKFAFFLFAISIFLYPIGLILEKKGMSQVGEITSLGQLFTWGTIIRITTNPYVIGGVAVCFIGLILWLTIISNLNISYIFPFGALSYIVLAVMAYFLLDEPITLYRWLGIMTIVLGAFLINQK